MPSPVVRATASKSDSQGSPHASGLSDDCGRGTASLSIQAMEYVIDNDIKLSNNSWGTSAYSQAVYDVIEASQAIGHVFVASAGNVNKNTDFYPHYPSSYDLPNIISVAATDHTDDLASFSSYGPTTVDLGAPGATVYSTVLGTAYGYKSGTSMAAPHVTGVVALVMSRRPDWAAQKVIGHLLAAVRPVDALVGITVTGGVVNALNVGDCNENGVADEVDIAGGTSLDCSGNGIPDECEADCNGNGVPDSCDIFSGTSADCNGNIIPDECEPDCNVNGVPDSCDIAVGTSNDCQHNVIPDECELIDNDCNDNTVPDDCDIADGTSIDCTDNLIPDECEVLPDCNSNGAADYNDLCSSLSDDCNKNDIPDECDVAGGGSQDCNGNIVPDECDSGLQVLLLGPYFHADFILAIWELGHFVTRAEYGSSITNLSPYDVVIVNPTFGDSEYFGELLDGFIAAGGGLIILQPSAQQATLAGSCNPVLATEGWVLRDGTRVVDSESPLTSGLATMSGLDGYGVVPTLKAGAKTVITWIDDVPMAVTYTFGYGKVVYFNDYWAAFTYCWHGGPGYGTALMANAFAYLAKLPGDCNRNGVPDECDLADGSSLDDNGNSIPDECDDIVFVNADVPGRGDGTSWVSAYADLQVALAEERATEIWIAAGTYRPAGPGSDRAASFRLRRGLRIYGGFAGGESVLHERDAQVNLTILCGDLNGDDGPDWTNRSDNCYRVVTGRGTNESTLLDGCTIRGSHNGDVFPDCYGGGLYLDAASLTVANCTFSDNWAYAGGGMYTYWTAEAIMSNCTFTGNAGYNTGGGMENYGDVVLVNCLFNGNTAGNKGGGIYNQGSAILVNCTFSANNATNYGGGVENSGGLTLNNSVLWANTDGQTAEESGQLHQDSAADWTEVRYSCVQGWTGEFGGVGNIGDDPRFVDADGDDDVPGTGDDNLRILPNSPCIDVGDNTALPASLTTDRDGEPRLLNDPDSPDTGNGAPPIVDMGAYEFAPDCNGNGISDWKDLLNGTSPDCNSNAIPDECDVSRGISDDCTGNIIPDECETVPDCNGSGTADHNDVCTGQSEDCNANGGPDECDITGGTSADCNDTGIPDECEDDCNKNGLADECDVAGGTSNDDNSNGVPDECEVARNRYISFVPDRGPEAVAYQVALTESADFPDSVGSSWWVEAPATNGTARLANVPVFRDWSVDRTLIQIADCPIVPVATYEIRSTTDGTTFSDPVVVFTAGRPAPKQWGDVVGSFSGTEWTGPNGTVNMDDVMAAVQKFKQLTSAPLLTWVDVDGEVPNAVLNMADIFQIVQGFKAKPYPFSDPADCP